jgi:hypothetical protein
MRWLLICGFISSVGYIGSTHGKQSSSSSSTSDSLSSKLVLRENAVAATQQMQQLTVLLQAALHTMHRSTFLLHLPKAVAIHAFWL